jgi:hypothetical protein
MPAYASQNTVYGKAFALTVLAALTTRPAAALFGTLKVRLVTAAPFAPTPNNVIADFLPNEATFVGYTAGGYAPTWSAAVNLSGNIVGIVTNVTPICTSASAPSPNVITGYWVDDGTNVIVAEGFPGGLTFGFVNPGDFLDLQVNIPFQLYQQL